MKKQNKKVAQKETKNIEPKTLQSLPDNKSIHTKNPFTGKETDITQDDLDNMEKWNEAQTERD